MQKAFVFSTFPFLHFEGPKADAGVVGGIKPDGFGGGGAAVRKRDHEPGLPLLPASVLPMHPLGRGVQRDCWWKGNMEEIVSVLSCQ